MIHSVKLSETQIPGILLWGSPACVGEPVAMLLEVSLVWRSCFLDEFSGSLAHELMLLGEFWSFSFETWACNANCNFFFLAVSREAAKCQTSGQLLVPTH